MRRFGEIRAALGDFDFEFEVVGSGRRWSLDSSAFDVMHQTWVREPDTRVYRLDIFREPHDGDTWTPPGEHGWPRPWRASIQVIGGSTCYDVAVFLRDPNIPLTGSAVDLVAAVRGE